MGAPTMPHHDLAEFVAAGMRLREIAEHYSVSPRTVERWCKSAGLHSQWSPPARIEKHGTLTEYANGCRCSACTEANRLRMREQNANRRQRTQDNGGIAPVRKHGYSTATNWGCRCSICLTAVRERNRENHRRRYL